MRPLAPKCPFLLTGLFTGLSLAMASPATGQAPVIVRPGDPHLVVSHLIAGEDRIRGFRRAATGDTAQWSEGYSGTESVVRQGKDLLQVKVSDVHGRRFVDSLLFHRTGLVPVTERMSVGGPEHTVLTYAGARVRRETFHGDSVVAVSDSAFSVPVFGFNQLDLVLRSLPLRPGYRAILPLYSEGTDQLELDSVTVLHEDRQARGGAGIWTVQFADPAIVATYDITMADRRIVRHEIRNRTSGDRFRIVADTAGHRDP